MNQAINYEILERARNERFNGIPRYWILVDQTDHEYVIDIVTNNMVQYERFIKYGTFSDQWKLRGFALSRPFGRIGTRIEPIDFIRNNLREDMKYKNGNCKYFILDFDYGSERIWGNRAKAFMPLR